MLTPRAQKGFTLVETLVAISVLLLAIAAPLTLGSQGLTSSRIARDQVTATYLIQEAIEYARNTRDTNILSGNGWLTGLDACVTGSCRIDVPQDTVAACTGTCPVLNYNSVTGIYGYTSGSNWTATKFRRTVTLQHTVNNVEAFIVVTVAWQDGLVSRTISADEYLLNWQ
jgi:prepilin-type N-terminal cleavage/methylation domain-containing protein